MCSFVQFLACIKLNVPFIRLLCMVKICWGPPCFCEFCTFTFESLCDIDHALINPIRNIIALLLVNIAVTAYHFFAGDFDWASGV